MNHLDVLYRALSDYKKQIKDDRDCKQMRKAIVLSNPELDQITSTKNHCTIEEDWIEAVEKGLIFIEKAINEARQHIHTKGEVVPIETVKRVSKDSLKHLAKHSDFITREPQDENLIPDKLYIVERLSDFAVYENRFLYMLLCYLENFISTKYSKILDLSNTFKCSLTMNKIINVNKRKMVFRMEMTDEKRDDPYLKQTNPLKSILERIDNILKTVIHLLATPLIQEVSKAPVLKPPITKTNVLKMNQNFKGAVALYDFITAYEKPGYSNEISNEQISPFSDAAAEEFAEIVMLSSFLSYKYGLGINKALEKAYDEEETRKSEAEVTKLKEQLFQLKNRISQNDIDPTEYILLLEKRNNALEIDSLKLEEAYAEIEKLNIETAQHKNTAEALNRGMEQLNNEIAAINEKFICEKESLISMFDGKIKNLREVHNREKEEILCLHKEQTESITARYEQIVSELLFAHNSEKEIKDNMIKELENRIIEEANKFSLALKESESAYINKINTLQLQYLSEVSRLEKLNANVNNQNESLMEAKALSDSRVNALRREYNLITNDEDFTAKISFDELEHQYKVFKTFFKEEWKKTKKNIRKEILRSDNESQDGVK